ncbi:voltage-gated potassium channel protein, putative [Bodo saltans]|uniref:Voltage-gated potassium channel protein, putative n=1 Tax=Bodo saltans TaxID=75058 RepID=A0A0S4IS19_BODSA|nr:voltage-gated potassium channel protein, putative [Bodo saltans]|eukprot:CUF46133.1 voltage-gated potassium channel protein, putative [Bodo saltans]
MMLGAATVARHRPDLDNDDNQLEQELPPQSEIPHLHSSGSSSSDTDDDATLRSPHRQSATAAAVNDVTSAEQQQQQQDSIVHATTMLYMSPARTQYHKKILDRMGLKSTDPDFLHDASEDASSPFEDRDSISMSSGSQDVLSKSSSMFFSKSFALHHFSYPQEQDTTVSWRDKLYGLFTNYEDLGLQYQIDAKWRKANAFNVRFTSVVVVISIFSLCFDTVADFKDSAYPFFLIVECICVAWLAIDLAVRSICTRESFVCFWSDPMSVTDFVSLLPLFVEIASGPDIGGLAVIRVIRLIRTVRLMRSSRTQGILELFRAMRKSVTALSLLFFLLVITMFVSSSIIYLLDIQRASFDNNENLWIRNDGTISPFQSIFHTMWFCLTTLTTVGYGDDLPFSPWAKAASALLMVTGVLVIAFPTVILSASFHSAYSERFLTTLRNNLTDKQRESLAYGRNRQVIKALAGGRNGFGFANAGATAKDQQDGSVPGGTKATFRSRLLSLMRKNSDGEGTEQQQQHTPPSDSAINVNNDEPSTVTAVVDVPPSTVPATRKTSGGSRWAVLKKLAAGDDVSVASNSQSDGITSEGTSAGSKRRPVVKLQPIEEAPPKVAFIHNTTPPKTSPTTTVSPVSPTTGKKSVRTVQDLDKRFAIPELGRIKIAFVPFAPISQSALKSSRIPSKRLSQLRHGSVNAAGDGKQSSSDDDDDDDTRGVVCASKLHSHRRKSGLTTQSQSIKSLKMAERKAKATATFGRDGVEVVHSSTDSNASLSTSSDESDEKELCSGTNPLGVMSANQGILTPNYSSSPQKPAFRRSRAPTIVMARKSIARDKPVKTETNIFSKIDESIESLNYNMQQLKSQMICANGIVTYPPKLKLMCVGGSSTLSIKVEQCFPPGSHSLCFTVVIDDPEYHRVQKHLATLSFGTDRVRRVELAQMHKLRVDLRVGNIRMFVAAKREALSQPPLSATELEEESHLIHELLSDNDRQLLDSCYLATTTYRNIIASTVDVVVMCPSTAAFKVFQRSLHMLKFTFDVQFRKPQFMKVAVNPQHAQNISIAADAIIIDRLRRKLRTVEDDTMFSSPARTETRRTSVLQPTPSLSIAYDVSFELLKTTRCSILLPAPKGSVAVCRRQSMGVSTTQRTSSHLKRHIVVVVFDTACDSCV